MKVKALAKQLTPPLFWTMAKKALNSCKKSSKINIRNLEEGLTPNTPQLSIQTDEYKLSFTKVALEAGVYFVPKYAEHRPACVSVLRAEFHEPKTHSVVSELMRMRPGNLIHAGTFFGDMLPSFAKVCGGKVYAFEPVLENYVLAKLCVEASALNNVVLLNAGLGSEISVARVDTGETEGRHRGGSSEISERGQLTSMVTIDSLSATHVSLIQLDVEGHELEALKGAMNTIIGNRPVIMIEDNSDNCAEFLASVDYQFAAEIPGLKIWQSKRDDLDVRTLFR